LAKALHFIIDKCTGCHQCELACSGMREGVFATERSRIRIFELKEMSKNVPYACLQCEEAWCMHACPVDAIFEVAETGVKVLLEDRCVGCKVCTIACPYGTVNYYPDAGKVLKCDLCHGDDMGPACIASCPTGAIELAEREVVGASGAPAPG